MLHIVELVWSPMIDPGVELCNVCVCLVSKSSRHSTKWAADTVHVLYFLQISRRVLELYSAVFNHRLAEESLGYTHWWGTAPYERVDWTWLLHHKYTHYDHFQSVTTMSNPL